MNKTLDRLLDLGIRPHASAIAEIVGDGKIACVVFELASEHHTTARLMGWDGVSPVFEMSEAIARRLAGNLGKLGDQVSEAWLTAKRDGRIYVMADNGTLLVNFEPGQGFSLEPGSTGNAWTN